MNNCFHRWKHQRNRPPNVTRDRPLRNSFFSVTIFLPVETKRLPPTATAGDLAPSALPARSQARRGLEATAARSVHAIAKRRRGRRRGGDDRVRTDDPLLAKQVLSQLSYAPNFRDFSSPNRLVGQGGFEPPTPRLSSVCSNQLSY
jgi:hypothetical protein